jgi:antitoxin component of RelBE/YafQ-DinJ toxin-antitoxin module
MSSKKYMGTRVPGEKKDAAVEFFEELGLDQSTGLERALDEMMSRYQNKQELPPVVPYQQNSEKMIDDNQPYEKTYEKSYEEEARYVTNGRDELEPIFEDFPLLNNSVECEVRNAWRTAVDSDEKAPKEVLFLEEFADRLLKVRGRGEGYSCPKIEIALPGVIVQLVEEIAADATMEAQEGTKEELLMIMSNLAASKAESMYNSNREITLGFSRSE